MIYLSNLVVGLDTGLDNPNLLLETIAPFAGQVGIELFLHSHSSHYKEKLLEAPAWLGSLPRTAHGPFIGVEATSPPLSDAGRNLFDSYRFAMGTACRLESQHLVFHSNECVVSPEQKPLLQRRCLDNLDTLMEMADSFGITLLLENLGLPSKGTPLFDQDEYLALFARYPQVGCLLDMGHLYLAKWDDERVISQLATRITGYHLHNNDGLHDSHCRIVNGGYDYDRFFALYRRYTPHADLTLEYGDNHGITVAQLQHDLTRLFDSTIRCPE